MLIHQKQKKQKPIQESGLTCLHHLYTVIFDWLIGWLCEFLFLFTLCSDFLPVRQITHTHHGKCHYKSSWHFHTFTIITLLHYFSIYNFIIFPSLDTSTHCTFMPTAAHVWKSFEKNKCMPVLIQILVQMNIFPHKLYSLPEKKTGWICCKLTLL